MSGYSKLKSYIGLEYFNHFLVFLLSSVIGFDEGIFFIGFDKLIDLDLLISSSTTECDVELSTKYVLEFSYYQQTEKKGIPSVINY